LRYELAANVRWKQLDVYGAVIWDRLYGLRGAARDLRGTATGLTIQADYLVHEKLMLSSRFDQLWAVWPQDEKQTAPCCPYRQSSIPGRTSPSSSANSVNLRSVVEDSRCGTGAIKLFVGIDWDF